MSHHYSGPDFGFPFGDARLDLTDVYAFPKPEVPGRSILIMNVHPSSTVVNPQPTTREPFSPDAVYEIRIDTNGDAVAEIAYRMFVANAPDGGQTATLVRARGTCAAGMGAGGEIIVERVRVSSGADPIVAQGADHQLFVGWRSEPFFFDTLGAINNLQFTGADFFADKNVCSIVLDIPDSAFGSKSISLWARILVNNGGGWTQVERGARPQQAVFLPGPEKATYMAGEPADDARFVQVFAHALEHTGGYSTAEATQVAGSLLPDMMPYEPGRPVSYPTNGRTLTDDAADAFIAILTNGKITNDGVGAHQDLMNDFPYLGPPHNA